MQNPLKVLIIEDSEDDTELLLTTLRQAGYLPIYKVVETREAMQSVLYEENWQVIISDHQLPQFDSFHALSVLHDSGLDIPFIIVSGVIGEEVAVEAMRSGAHDYILKASLTRLIAAIERELREAENRKEHRNATFALVQSEKRYRFIAQELRQALEIRDDFLSAASHELKTPITSMKLRAQILNRLLARNETPERARIERLAATLNVQLGRLCRLIEDMFDITKINVGHFIFKMSEVNVAELVNRVVKRYQEQVVSRKGTIVAKIEEDILAKWDSSRMMQVLDNLLSNAVKYGDGKPIEVKVERVGRDRVLLKVIDQGIGIPDEDQTKIFSRFERAIPTSNISGLGLGLYIVAQILKAHQGSIRVESKPGHGSTFYVELPLVPNQALLGNEAA